MKILIAEPIHEILQTRLTARGFKVDVKTDTTEAELKQIIDNYNGLVVRSRFTIDQSILRNAANLKFIARAGSGIENIDSNFAAQKHIEVINSPEGNAQAVGEHALGLLLGLLHKIHKSAQEVKSGNWDRKNNTGTELDGKLVGIIGYGNTGSRFAQVLRGFNLQILAYDKYKSGFSNEYLTECSLETIFEKVDVVSFHLPLTAETRYMCDKDFINRFQKPVYLINTSRGEVVKTDDVLEALNNRKLSGAGFDVLEYEKNNFEKLMLQQNNGVLKELLQKSNVIITPHIAGSSSQSVFKIADVLADKIIAKYGSL